MHSDFLIRPATLDDIPIIAAHRAGMFADMGMLPERLRDDLVGRTLDNQRTAVPAGE